MTATFRSSVGEVTSGRRGFNWSERTSEAYEALSGILVLLMRAAHVSLHINAASACNENAGRQGVSVIREAVQERGGQEFKTP